MRAEKCLPPSQLTCSTFIKKLFGYPIECLLDILVTHPVVDQVSVQVLVIGAHVDQAVAGQVEQDNLLFAGLLAFLGFSNGGGDGMARLGGRNDALGAGKEHSGIKGFELRNIYATHQPILEQLRDDHACTMIAQTASMDVSGLERVTQREHRQQGRVTRLVAKVVTELATGEFRAAGRQ